MLIQVLILSVVSAAHATYAHGGKSVSSREDDDYGNYIFSYDIEDPLGATNGRYEVGDAYGNKKGYYTITDIDGRVRRVDYVADEHGFRATVQTNEPGTAASRPASALISSPYEVNQPVFPVSTVKTVVNPVVVAPVEPIAVGSVKTVHPVAVDHISQTVHEVPIGSVKGVSHPVAVAPVVPPVRVGSVKGVSHPFPVAPAPPVPVGSVKGVSHPVSIDHISQTVHDVPVVQQPVQVDYVPQTIQEFPFGPVKETFRPVKIAQTAHHPKKFFAGGIHDASPVIRGARTFREAQTAHAASFRPNLYNGEYSVKYAQPAPPIVKRLRPSTVYRYPLLQHTGVPRIDSLQLIDSAPIADVSANVVPITSVHASPVTHVKGTPFHQKGTPFYQNGLFRHVYGSSLKKPGSFRSHLL